MKSISGITSALGVAANWIGHSVATSDFAKNLNNVDNRQPEDTQPYFSSTVLTTLGFCGLFAAGVVAVEYLQARYPNRVRRTELTNSLEHPPRENKKPTKKAIRISSAGSRMQKIKEAKINPPPPSRAKISKHNVSNIEPSKQQVARQRKGPNIFFPQKNAQWTFTSCEPGSYIVRHVIDPGMCWKIELTKEYIEEMYLNFLKLLPSEENPPTFEEYSQILKKRDDDIVENLLKSFNPQPGHLLKFLKNSPFTITRLWTPDLKTIPKEDYVLPVEPFEPSPSLTSELPIPTPSLQKRKHLSSQPITSSDNAIASQEKPRELINTPVFEAQYDLLKNNDLSNRLEKFISDAKFRSIPGGHAHKVGDWLSVPINPENTASGKGRWRILFQMSPEEVRVYGIVDYHDNKLVHWREKDIASALKNMKS